MNHTVPAYLRVVDNTTYAYTYQVCLGPNTTVFYAARITYQYTSAGD